MEDDAFSASFPASDLSVVARVAERVEAFGSERKIARRLVNKLNLALDEVLTNIISYASPDGRCRQIAIRVEYRDGDLTAGVSDDGEPFNPLLLPPPDIDAAIEDRPVGGLGIHLVRKLMDAVDYRRTEGRNHLELRLHVGAADPSGC